MSTNSDKTDEWGSRIFLVDYLATLWGPWNTHFFLDTHTNHTHTPQNGTDVAASLVPPLFTSIPTASYRSYPKTTLALIVPCIIPILSNRRTDVVIDCYLLTHPWCINEKSWIDEKRRHDTKEKWNRRPSCVNLFVCGKFLGSLLQTTALKYCLVGCPFSTI